MSALLGGSSGRLSLSLHARDPSRANKIEVTEVRRRYQIRGLEALHSEQHSYAWQMGNAHGKASWFYDSMGSPKYGIGIATPRDERKTMLCIAIQALRI